MMVTVELVALLTCAALIIGALLKVEHRITKLETKLTIIFERLGLGKE